MNNSYNKTLVFTAACIGMCFFGVAMLIMGAILPSLVEKLSLSGLQTTALVTFLPIGMLVGSLVFGPIVDRFGHKALLVPSCILVLLGLEGLAIFETVPLLQISIVAIGFGGGILNGETNALVSEIYDDSMRGSRLSFLGMFYGLGALFIPVLMAALEKSFSFETILHGVGVIMLIGIIFCIPVRFPAPKQPQGFPVKEGVKMLKDKVLIMLSFILFFQSGIEGICNNWSTSYFVGAAGLPEEKALIILTCMVIGLTLARVLQIGLFRKVKPEAVLPYTLLLTAVGCACILFSPGVVRAAAGMVMIGMGLSATFPVILSVLGNKYAELSGTAFSVALVIALLGQTALNALIGMLSQYGAIGYYPYCVIGSLAIMYLLFKGSTRK